MSDALTTPLSNVFNSDEHRKLAQIQRFLTNVADPVIVRRAALHGYDDQEHAQGWSLYGQATGMDRALSFFVSAKEQTEVSADDFTKSLLRVIDQFENKWFPRAESVLKRYIDATQHPTFNAAFFEDLVQQPEGPLVVDSASKLLDRMEALESSAVSGAREAFGSLVKRGLTVEVRNTIRAQLESARKLRPASSPTAATTVDLAEAAQNQRAAYEKLVSWHQDWATTFRQELDHHSLLRLGLRSPRSSKRSPDATPNET